MTLYVWPNPQVTITGAATEVTSAAILAKLVQDIGAPSAGLRTVEAGLSKAEVPIRRDCSSAALNTGSWTTLFTASATNTQMHFYNGTGYSIQIGFGTGPGITTAFIVPPGGDVVRLLVPSGETVSLQPYVNITDGEIVINFLK
jgi:hypothetical protein